MYSFDNSITALLTEPEYEMGDWIFAAPPACYLQFPYQKLWARVAADAPYEPLDGVFVVAANTEERADSGVHVRVQMVLGLRPDRPGVSLVSYRDDLDPEKVAARAKRPWRAEGVAYANAIPGGERMGYRTLATTSELEALVIRAFHYLDTHPDRLERVTEVRARTRRTCRTFACRDDGSAIGRARALADRRLSRAQGENRFKSAAYRNAARAHTRGADQRSRSRAPLG